MTELAATAAHTTCPTCGSQDVRWYKGELHDVTEYPNGARYLRGPHKPTCDKTMAARKTWDDKQRGYDEAMEEARRIREDAANEKTSAADAIAELVTEAAQEPDYKMQHQAPGYDPEGTTSPLHDIEGVMPDYYAHPDWYGGGSDEPGGWQSQSVIQRARGNPEAKVRIYRAMPAEHAHHGINPGDWVGISKEYARQHGRQHSETGADDWPVISAVVRAKHLFNEGYPTEFGYGGPELEPWQHSVSFKGGRNQEIRQHADGAIHPVKRRSPPPNVTVTAEGRYRGPNIQTGPSGAHTSVDEAHDYMTERYPQVDHWISERPDSIVLNKIVVPKEQRGQGVGSAYMRDLLDYADRKGKRVELTPNTGLGASSQSRLERFYKGFGFIPNKGRNRDLMVNNTMYRPAQPIQPEVVDSRTEAARFAAKALDDSDPDMGFHVRASWADVRAKAKRIRSSGGVRILADQGGEIVAQVHGDHGIYQSEITFVPGSHSTAAWACSCPYAAFAWGRTGQFKKLEGRVCSHVLALRFEAQRRRMFGKDVELDVDTPHWISNPTVPVREPTSYDRDTGDYPADTSMPKAAAVEWREWRELEPHQQEAAATYHGQMQYEGGAGPDETPESYLYQVRDEPAEHVKAKVMEGDPTTEEGHPSWDAYHQQYLGGDEVPHHPADKRWPVIVDDANRNYIDDGYHRFHSYVRDGAATIPTMRMQWKGNQPVKAAALSADESTEIGMVPAPYEGHPGYPLHELDMPKGNSELRWHLIDQHGYERDDIGRSPKQVHDALHAHEDGVFHPVIRHTDTVVHHRHTSPGKTAVEYGQFHVAEYAPDDTPHSHDVAAHVSYGPGYTIKSHPTNTMPKAQHLMGEIENQFGDAEDEPIAGVLGNAGARHNSGRLAVMRSNKDHEILGLAHYHHAEDDPKHYSLDDMAVAPGHQHKGFGGAIISHIASQTPPGARMDLDEAVENAVPFYQSTGAQFPNHLSEAGEWSPEALDAHRANPRGARFEVPDNTERDETREVHGIEPILSHPRLLGKDVIDERLGSWDKQFPDAQRDDQGRVLLWHPTDHSSVVDENTPPGERGRYRPVKNWTEMQHEAAEESSGNFGPTWTSEDKAREYAKLDSTNTPRAVVGAWWDPRDLGIGGNEYNSEYGGVPVKPGGVGQIHSVELYSGDHHDPATADRWAPIPFEPGTPVRGHSPRDEIDKAMYEELGPPPTPGEPERPTHDFDPEKEYDQYLDSIPQAPAPEPYQEPPPLPENGWRSMTDLGPDELLPAVNHWRQQVNRGEISEDTDPLNDFEYQTEPTYRLRPKTAAVNEPVYYHGTRYPLKPGDILEGNKFKANQGYGEPAEHVYYSEHPEMAAHFAEAAYGPEGHLDAPPRVFRVKPLDTPEVDPDEESQFKSWRSQRVKVLSEEPQENVPIHLWRSKMDPQYWQNATSKTGAVTIPYMRNNSGDFRRNGPGYGMSIEPWGKYMVEAPSEGNPGHVPDGWESGQVTFANPLRVPWESAEGWKTKLSQEHGGLTGQALSNALLDKGHDGIITYDKHGTAEIVDLRPEQGERYKTAALGPEPKYEDYNDVDRYRVVRNRWRSDIRHELAMGHITPDEAIGYGYHGWNHDQHNYRPDWKPLPPTLYHVTTNVPAVHEQGLKSRAELAQQRGKGLGGGEDDTISYTDNPETARNILHSVHEFHNVVTGKTTPQDLLDQAERGERAPRPFLQDLVHHSDSEWQPGQPLPRDLDDTLHGMKTKQRMATQEQMDAEEPGWTPHPDAKGWKARAGEFHMLWQRPATPDEQQERAADLYKRFSAYREFAGGHPDPLFFSTDLKGFAAANPEHIGIVKAHPKPGAQGYQLGSLGEWRTTTGQNVDVDRGHDPKTAAKQGQCSNCKGKGQFSNEKGSWDCPTCKGKGTVDYADGWSVPKLPPEQQTMYDRSDDPHSNYRNYDTRGLALAKNPVPGTVIWRGEIRHKDDVDRPPSVGMHWSVKPEMASSLLPRASDLDPDQRRVLWEATLDDPATQAISRAHPIWMGRYRSLDPEAEVRLKPGATVRLTGAYVHDGHTPEDNFDTIAPMHPERSAAGWSKVQMDTPTAVEHRRARDDGLMDYQGQFPNLFPKTAALASSEAIGLTAAIDYATSMVDVLGSLAERLDESGVTLAQAHVAEPAVRYVEIRDLVTAAATEMVDVQESLAERLGAAEGLQQIVGDPGQTGWLTGTAPEETEGVGI